MKIAQKTKFALLLTAVTTFSGLNMSVAYANISNKNEGYVVDTRSIIVKDTYNECWKTGYWIPAMAIAECDPKLVKKEEPKVVAPAPAPAPAPVIAPAPAPKPAPVVAAPAAPVVEKVPAPQKLTLSADSLFAFNRAIIKPEGQKKLNKFLEDIKGIHFDLITVTGHADRIGTPKANMKISVKRAEAVKAYLIKHGGIASIKIKAIGKGETEPVTKPGECKGEIPTKELIDCKQPDRRVEVEVSGTK